MNNNAISYLLGLGFSTAEINSLNYIYINGGKLTPSALQSYGFDYMQSKRLLYMNKILQGGVQINSENDMITHVKKMTGASRDTAKQAVYRENLANGYGAKNYTKDQLIKHLKDTNGRIRKLTIQDLKVSNVTEVPRVAIVGNIIDEPYAIWNSNRYKGKDALYKVTDVTGQKITVETPRKPKLEYKKPRVIPGVLEIKGLTKTGDAIVSFNKQYCKLCNRFIIVASLRNPEFHFGKYEIICCEGSKLYVYATSMGTKENVNYSMGNARVYDYGIFPGEIAPKLKTVAQGLYKSLCGVSVELCKPTAVYTVIPKDKDKEKLEENNNDGVLA